MDLCLSVALPPSAQIADYAAAVERVGCKRLWLFDSPAIYGDIWIAAARAADATRGLVIGTGVAVPSLRHPMVTAAAIATIEDAAPGRLTCAFGTGFTARRAMGQNPMRWTDVGVYVRQLRGLLAGEVVEIEGAPCQMLHLQGWAPDRPLETPLWVAPSGPKGNGGRRGCTRGRCPAEPASSAATGRSPARCHDRVGHGVGSRGGRTKRPRDRGRGTVVRRDVARRVRDGSRFRRAGSRR